MKFKNITFLLTLIIFSSLFLQCSKDDQLNQVGTWDAKYFLKQYTGDSLTVESIANVEMILRSDETGIVRGLSGEGNLEWDLVFSDTEINLTESYGLFDQSVIPLETSLTTRYEILIDEKDLQEWHYEKEFMLTDGSTIRTLRTWRLSK